MLFTKKMCYLNGEAATFSGAQAVCMQQFADTRQLHPNALSGLLDQTLLEKLHAWYLVGYIQFISD
jgi:hypothetical protein